MYGVENYKVVVVVEKAKNSDVPVILWMNILRKLHRLMASRLRPKYGQHILSIRTLQLALQKMFKQCYLQQGILSLQGLSFGSRD